MTADALPHGSVVAVDGGGTRCRLALAMPDRTVIVTGGAANVSTDFAGAVRTLRAGLFALAAEAGVVPDALRPSPAYLGLAGAVDDGLAARVAAALPLDRAIVEEDRACAVAGALGADDGGVALCGTGSFFACRRAGAMRIVGGWGPALGDAASGVWLARRALTTALAALEGWAPSSPFLDGLCASGRATLIERGGAPPAVLAPAARDVADAAEAGDAAAARLMRDGAADLSRLLAAAGWTPDLPLCLVGGLGPRYAPWLDDAARAALVAARGTPLDGAIRLARGA